MGDVIEMGQKITLADGTTRMLRFNFRAILNIEKRFGSLNEFAKGLDDNKVETLLFGLAETLCVEPKVDEESVIPLLDFERWAEYRIAMIDGFTDALKPRDEAEAS